MHLQKDLENVLKELIDQAETVDRIPRKIERYERYERSLYHTHAKNSVKE